jgi:PIN domain nuclease of toxin-antitoxin system
MEQRITIDAHTLIWYADKDSNALLSRQALNAIEQAEAEGIIYVPIIALFEIMRLIEKRKYPIVFDQLKVTLRNSHIFQIVPFDFEILETSEKLKTLELHDRTIVATALVKNTVLVSMDRLIAKVYSRTIW